jgi:hypothetical protein
VTLIVLAVAVLTLPLWIIVLRVPEEDDHGRGQW